MVPAALKGSDPGLERLAGNWRLGELLGKGGTASVYRAVHADGRVGAVKVMHPHLAYERDWIRRLRREAKLLRAVDHPGLVRLLDVGQMPDNSPFLVMELLEGRSLEDLRKEHGGPMPLARALRYATDVLDILVHTHARGIVHRDLKPSNVFVTDSGQVKVLDFGIASGVLHETLHETQSATRGILGTPAYMSPEQARGRWELVDHRADLWAVGAMIFVLTSGQYVHVAHTENERLGLAMSRPARSLASVTSGIPVALVAVVDCALEYEMARRWQSAEEFRNALAAVAAGRNAAIPSVTSGDATVRESAVPSSRSAQALVRGRSRLGMLAGVLAAVVSAALVAYAFFMRDAREVEPEAQAPEEVRAPAPAAETAPLPPATATEAAPAAPPNAAASVTPPLVQPRRPLLRKSAPRRDAKTASPLRNPNAEPGEDLMDRRE